ncbi:MAG TPA: HIRAN domain-containing protein, partial [Rhodanobacteraceae bacterium]|nr:HIRAN domain-containing protein [Rhodanobacteraceae bacterium]
LRLDAARMGDAHAAKSLLVRFQAEPDIPIPTAKRFGPALPLAGAPVVPLPRWSVSWGHPLQQAIRAFAAQLDGNVLETLGWLEVPGPFFGSVVNYNRLAMLPPAIRAHRLQALREFPPLVAPLLLDVFGRPDMFGTDEDEPEQRACRDAEITPVLEAMDRGRDLIGALSEHYRISRALVRSPPFREPWAGGHVEHVVLRLLDAIPAHARPCKRESVESRLPALRALPLTLRNTEQVASVARAFAQGWDATWQALEAHSRALPNELRDTRDFLRAALDQVERPEPLANLDMETLAQAWLARRGLRSLLDASRRWHAQPLVTEAFDDGLPKAVISIWDATPRGVRFDCEGIGRATEIYTREALMAEGATMHHCIGGYWQACVLQDLRVVHIDCANGESATALYRGNEDPDDPKYELEQLRGPCNTNPSHAARQFAMVVRAGLNNAAWHERRVAASRNARSRRAAWQPRPSHSIRRLDLKSRDELRMVLAACAAHSDGTPRPAPLLSSAIAGFGHADGPRLQAQLAPGDALQLVRELANPHDANAVRIDWNGHKLGYVPRAENPDIARRLDAGEPLAAAITAITCDATVWNPVAFEIRPA